MRIVFKILFLLTICSTAQAHGAYRIVVLKEHGLGSASQAQPYVDKLVSLVAQRNGWSSASGKYLTRRARAEQYIKSERPQFGILSVGAFLALQKAHGLAVLGTADVARAGGRQYHLISKQASNLDGCKGKRLASDHLADPKFVDRVIAKGAFTLSNFDLLPTRRPVQTIKKVSRGKAVCALIDDAQLAELSHIRGAKGIKKVWSSQRLPPMAVVAFSSASAADRAKFKSNLEAVCTGGGKSYCDKVGIRALKPAKASVYTAVLRAYTR